MRFFSCLTSVEISFQETNFKIESLKVSFRSDVVEVEQEMEALDLNYVDGV